MKGRMLTISDFRLVFVCPKCGGHAFGSRTTGSGIFGERKDPGVMIRDCQSGIRTCDFEWPETDDWKYFAFLIPIGAKTILDQIAETPPTRIETGVYRDPGRREIAWTLMPGKRDHQARFEHAERQMLFWESRTKSAQIVAKRNGTFTPFTPNDEAVDLDCDDVPDIVLSHQEKPRSKP